MKSLLVNIKNTIPYILLISIYFLFINLEARKQQTNNKSSQTENEIYVNESKINDNHLRIPIRVIPYSQ